VELIVPKVQDFAVTGLGDHSQWADLDWQPLTRVGDGTAIYKTHAKVAYSATGMYFLVEAEDRRISCSFTNDFANLFTEDVVEVFLWPHEPQITYFEYEISPLGKELPILVPNSQGTFHGWLPWHYTGDRKARKATSARGGELLPMALVDGWTTEFFIPFTLLTGLGNTPPQSGTRWRGNIYRIDYDGGSGSHWAWAPDTGANFHDYQHFGTFIFA
jgi:hypothetical protein